MKKFGAGVRCKIRQLQQHERQHGISMAFQPAPESTPALTPAATLGFTRNRKIFKHKQDQITSILKILRCMSLLLGGKKNPPSYCGLCLSRILLPLLCAAATLASPQVFHASGSLHLPFIPFAGQLNPVVLTLLTHLAGGSFQIIP